MRERLLIVFAKQPRLGQVKRRLAATIGDGPALRLYRGLLAALLRRLGRDRRWQTVVALTPDRGRHALRIGPGKIRRWPQGQGDLGERMGRAFRRAKHCRALLIGTDIPEILPRHIARGFHLLGQASLVLGPATDGGYWSVGLRHGASVGTLFRSVRWSTPSALADTLANRPPNWQAAFLDTLEDLDDSAALARWRQRLSRSSGP